MSKAYRIIFMGSPDFAIPTLQALNDSHHEIVAIYSQPPKPAGRGQHLTRCAVHDFALSQNFHVETPKNFKSDEAIETFKSFNADIAIVAAYGLLLPKTILSAPKHGCMNVHGSLLPKWRGAAPIQYAILKGDQETGVTIMKMDQGLDTGDMILKASFPILPEMTASECFHKIANMGADMTLKILEDLDQNLANAIPQDDALSTHAPKLKKEDGLVLWQDASQIDCQFRALTPWPSVFFKVKDEMVKIKSLEFVNGELPGAPGEILDHSGLIQCAKGQVRLVSIQPQNKKPMGFKDFLNGRSDLAIGDVLK